MNYFLQVKLWEVYNQRRCIRTYQGHKQAIRDVNFNNAGDQFLSASYDRNSLISCIISKNTLLHVYFYLVINRDALS